MIEALRGLGYSTATALADIIDNSISAQARSVGLSFEWAGDTSHVAILDDGIGMDAEELDGDTSHVAILDDGIGMDAEELDAAMRLGERSPLDARATDDLGRFGLGLKTASFSQFFR